jgi:beta-glucanase (GH16 family)
MSACQSLSMRPFHVAPCLLAFFAAAAAASCGSGGSSKGTAGGSDSGSGATGDAGGQGTSDATSGGQGGSSDGGGGGTTASDGGGTGSDDSGGGSGAPTPPPQVPSGWKLALDDEFDGTTLDTNNWSVGTNLTSFVVNGVTYWNPYQQQEAEYLTGSMVAVQGSNLFLSTEAAAQPITGPYGSKSYIAGYVTSYSKFAFQYGYIEFRMEMPDVEAGANTGLWPALWLLNSTYSNSDEIDVLESYGADQTGIQMTAQPSNSVTTTIAPGYHILAVLHEASTISFYVDNKLLKAFTQSMSSEMAILMGMQLGSAAFGWLPGPTPDTWPGGINGASTADFKVDWVHVWTPP